MSVLHLPVHESHMFSQCSDSYRICSGPLTVSHRILRIKAACIHRERYVVDCLQANLHPNRVKCSDSRWFIAEPDRSADHISHTHELEPVMLRSTFRPTLGAFPEISLISTRVQDDASSPRVLAVGAHPVSDRCLPAETQQLDRRKSFQDLTLKPICTFNISGFCCNAVPCTRSPLVRHCIGWLASPCPQEGLTRFHKRRFIEVRENLDNLVRAVSVLGWLEDPRPPASVSAESFCGFAQVSHASVDEAAVGNERGIPACFFAIPTTRPPAQHKEQSVRHRVFPNIQQTRWPSLGSVHPRRAWPLPNPARATLTSEVVSQPSRHTVSASARCVCGLNRLANTPDTCGILVPLRCPGYRGPLAWWQSTEPECRVDSFIDVFASSLGDKGASFVVIPCSF